MNRFTTTSKRLSAAVALRRRLRETARALLTCAFCLGILSAAGVALSLGAASPVEAGTCIEDADSPGTWHCSSRADRANDLALDIRATSGETLTVRDRGFHHDSQKNSGPAMRITAAAGSNGGSVVLDGNIMQSGRSGDAADTGPQDTVELINESGEAMTATFNGWVFQTSGESALNVQNRSSGDLTVNINLVAKATEADVIEGTAAANAGSTSINIGRNGEIRAPAENGAVSDGIDIDALGNGSLAIANLGAINVGNGAGISVRSRDTGSANRSAGAVSITNAGSIANSAASAMDSQAGIDARHGGSGDIVIENTSTGRVTTSEQTAAAIQAEHFGTGDIEITAGGHISGSGEGINAAVSNSGSGDITITLNSSARVTGAGGTAIQMTGGNTQRLVLNPGFRITGDIAAQSGSRSELELTGATGTGTLDLARFTDLDDQLIKTGAGSWNVTSSAENNRHSVAAVDIMAGALVLRNMHLNVTGSLTNSATIAFNPHNTAPSIDIGGAYQASGDNARLVLNVDFRDDSANVVMVMGAVTGTTSIDLRATGLADPEGEEITLIDATNSADNDDSFALGDFLAGGHSIDHENTEVRRSGDDWVLYAVGRSVGSLAYEHYASVLSHLGQLDPMRARFINRVWANQEGRGAWARVEGMASEIEPSGSTTNSIYEIRDARVRFGFDAPLRAVSGMTAGGNAWLGKSSTDISSAALGSSKIETEAYAFALTAHWSLPDIALYADAQAQYAVFSSDFTSGGSTLASGNGASSFTVSGELGYPVPVGGMIVTPQLQLVWADVDFDDFIDANLTRVSIDDGQTLNSRAGISVERKWMETGETEGSFHAIANLLSSIDGETSAQSTDDGLLVSELEETAVDLGIGVSFLLYETSALSADFNTTQGDEMEEYRGSLGLRFRF